MSAAMHLFGSDAIATLQGSYHKDRNSLTAPDGIPIPRLDLRRRARPKVRAIRQRRTSPEGMVASPALTITASRRGSSTERDVSLYQGKPRGQSGG